MDAALPELPIVMAFQHFSDYLNCPRKFNHRYIACDSPKEVKTGQQSSGINVHDALKRRLKLNEPLPQEFQQHEQVCAAILSNKESTHHVELGLGCTSDGRPCSFFDASCRLRTRIDLCALQLPLAVIIDWKTGKPWEDPRELNMQGLLLKIHYPQLEKIMATYFWLRQNRTGTLYTVNVEKTWNDICRWMQSIKFRIDNDDWPPDENPLCPWCPVGKDQCEFKRDRPT